MRSRLLKLLFRSLAILAVVALIVFSRGIYFVATADIGPILAAVRPPALRDNTGEVVASLEPAGWINPEDVPFLVQAIIAREDSSFRNHSGYTWNGLGRGVLSTVGVPGYSGGGSTISQQVARSIFDGENSLGNGRVLPGLKSTTAFSRYERKAAEIMVACWLESHLSKEEILSLYLNECYWAHGCRGVDAASRKSFGVPVTDLPSPHQILLTSFVQLPSRSRFPHGGKAYGREYRPWPELVNRIADTNADNERAATWAISEGFDFRLRRKRAASKQSHACDPWVTREVLHELRLAGIDSDAFAGGQVETTIDSNLQAAAAASLRPLPPGVEGAVTAIDISGGVLALVGGRTQHGQCRATTVRCRGLHSTEKAFSYCAGFEIGELNPSSIVSTDPIKLAGRPWPGESSVPSGARVSVEEAFRRSANAPVVRMLVYQPEIRKRYEEILNVVGIPAPRAGLPEDLIGNGASGVNLLGLAAGYSAFISSGLIPEPFLIKTVTDRDDTARYSATINLRRLASPKASAQVLSLLKTTVTASDGTAHKLGGILNESVGAKTGSHAFDQRVVIVLPDRGQVIAVWVGYDQPRKLPRGGLALDVAAHFLSRLGPLDTPRIARNP